MNWINCKCLFKYIALTVIFVGFSNNMEAMQQPAHGARKTVNNNGVKRQARINGKALINVVADRAKLIVEMLELIKKSPVEQVEGLDQVSADLLKKAYAEYHNKINNKENAADALCAYGYVIDTIIKRQQEIAAHNNGHAHQNVIMSYLLAPFKNIYQGFYAQPNAKTALKGVAGLGLYAGIIYGASSVLWKHILSGSGNLSEQESDDAKKERLAREQEAARLERVAQRERNEQEFVAASELVRGAVRGLPEFGRIVNVGDDMRFQPVIRAVEGVVRAVGNVFENGDQDNLRERYNEALGGERALKIAFIRDNIGAMVAAADRVFERMLGNGMLAQDPNDEAHLREFLVAGRVVFNRLINPAIINDDEIAIQGVQAEADRLVRLFGRAMQQMFIAVETFVDGWVTQGRICRLVKGALNGNCQQMDDGIEQEIGILFRRALEVRHVFEARLDGTPSREESIRLLQTICPVIVRLVRASLAHSRGMLLRAEGGGVEQDVDRRVAWGAALAVIAPDEQRWLARDGYEVQEETERLVREFINVMRQARIAAGQAVQARLARDA